MLGDQVGKGTEGASTAVDAVAAIRGGGMMGVHEGAVQDGMAARGGSQGGAAADGGHFTSRGGPGAGEQRVRPPPPSDGTASGARANPGCTRCACGERWRRARDPGCTHSVRLWLGPNRHA